jgi:Ran GTPase-activating protein (RanGAP) involved in mRNA processing and transport
MVKRSRSAAQLQSVDCGDLGSEDVDPETVQDESAALISTVCSLSNSEISDVVVAPANVQSRMIIINVQTLSGALPPIEISAGATVRDLKLRLQTLNAAFEFDCQKLLINESDDAESNVVLLNHRTLQFYQITENTKVVLVVLSSPGSYVWINDALKDTYRFQALLSNQDLHAIAINTSSICRHRAFLLQLCVESRVVRSIQICGRWTEENLRFCEQLLTLRPDIDIRFVLMVDDRNMAMLLLVVEFCKLYRCSSIQFKSHIFSDDGHMLIKASLPMSDFECGHWRIGAPGYDALASALMSMSWLQRLDLAGNCIGNEGCTALAPALQSMTSLQTLDLSGNHINGEGCDALARVLQSMSSLQTLGFGENYIMTPGCVALAPALQSMSFLKALNFRSNLFDVLVFIPAMQSMTSLQVLDLGCNNIGGASHCEALATTLQSMLSLQKLDLGFNEIGDLGCKALAPALQSMTSLLTLILSDNQIGDEGCVALATVLQSMTSLKSLELSYNVFSQEGFVSLVHVTQSMSSIMSLDIWSCQVDVQELSDQPALDVYEFPLLELVAQPDPDPETRKSMLLQTSPTLAQSLTSLGVTLTRSSLCQLPSQM